MITFIVFVLILSLLVMVHELGHFIAAKRMGIKVEEFGLGIPPRVWGKKIGETIYSYNLLPFGGFVKLLGEDATEPVSANDPRSFSVKAAWQKILVLAAGVFMNFVLAVILYYVLFFMTGFRTLNLPLIFDYDFRFGRLETMDTVITGFSENSVMERTDTEIGEVVVSIDGVKVDSVAKLREVLADKAEKEVQVELLDVSRLGENTGSRTLTVIPAKDEEGRGVLGIYLGKYGTLIYDRPVDKLLAGFLHSYNMLAYSGNVFGRLIGVSVESRSIAPVSEGVSGPVGVYSIVGGILEFGGPAVILNMLDFVALMSLSLAFLNIMPFPALDGGRIVFVAAEKLLNRKISPSFEANVHKWGILILLALIVLISVKDVIRFF